jgi:hypothetical protein
MENFMKQLKKLPLVVAVLFASVAFADNGCESEPVKAYDQGYPVKEDQMVGAYNSSARIDVRGSWDIFVTGSFIYYQVMQDGTDVGFDCTNPTVDPIKTHLVKMDNEFKPGFKVALGMNFSHDNWDAFVEYTRLHGVHSKVAKADHPRRMTSSWTVGAVGRTDFTYRVADANSYSKISANWEPNIDIIDASLGRAYYVGTKLTFRPFASFRSGWIDQEYTQKLFAYTDGASMGKFSAKADSWLVGPRMGVNTNWLLGCGFRFFSDAAASLLYQRSHVKLHDPTFVVGGGPNSLKAKDRDHNDVVPNLMLTMGFAWGSYFDHNNWNFDLIAGYTFEVFFKQNSMKYLRDDLGLTSGGESTNLIMHGLVVTARLDF